MYDKLNKKLLKLAGFKKKWVKGLGSYIMTQKGHDWYNEGVPRFTSSLDDSFKWLKPVIVKRLGSSAWERVLLWWLREMTVDREPGIALCLAIEKLIDEGDGQLSC